MKKLAFMLPIAGLVAIMYLTGCTRNELPVIDSLDTDPAGTTVVNAGDTLTIMCTATDSDEDVLTYNWSADAGTFIDPTAGSSVIWVAPEQSASVSIICTVTDVDTLNPVADTLTIEVQNYFPMAVDNRWIYEGQVVIETITLETIVDSEENLGGGEVRWHITRTFDFSTPVPTDSFSYYTVKGDSVFFYDAAEQIEYLLLELPLWRAKSWATGTGSTATVTEIKDRGTEAGNFNDCARVEISGGLTDNTIWLAPDIGIIVQTIQVAIGEIEFELIEYDLE